MGGRGEAMSKKSAEARAQLDGPVHPGYRTGAVARMVRMPVATLRIWERRYAVTAPPTTPTGHRQYSAADVQRLALIRQLTNLNHPIGSLAALDIDQLREVASTHATALARLPAKPSRRAGAWKLAVVGPGAAQRLQRPTVQLRLGRVMRITAAYRRLGDVRPNASVARHDALIVFVEGLQESLLPRIQAAARTLGARRIAVIHSFAAKSVTQAFVEAGVMLLHAPIDDDHLAESLSALASTRARRGEVAVAPVATTEPLPISGTAPQRRYDDATLADLAGLSLTISCECPRHLAEIVMQLSHFEAYSRQCQSLDVADAALHAYLAQVTGTARSLFESALERVAVHEGLVLPG